ncbi:DUF3467 domain-containing protein [Agromyces sp. CFH 90414]|uniref:DUF3467 domain-containing protein n=1 Tax=Agromyces agglutinans TaxID=2662258 RepID=A0A6I2F7N2_9MICO|nr:DUF3467 domain-containing protein [Agromyces agglutinans]MRG59787.1 DUF3467 domain-containing protein [Agromyces agglutinans]
MADERPRQFTFEIPPDKVEGSFADFASVWHTSTSFVIDFMTVTRPPTAVADEDGGPDRVVTPAQVVSRIRIPPQQVFELAKALTRQLEAWERETGNR